MGTRDGHPAFVNYKHQILERRERSRLIDAMRNPQRGASEVATEAHKGTVIEGVVVRKPEPKLA